MTQEGSKNVSKEKPLTPILGISIVMFTDGMSGLRPREKEVGRGGAEGREVRGER